VIIVTGNRADEIDRVVGLELGADDYLTKPFGLRELLARVRAVLRRLDRARAVPPSEHERGGYQFSGWRLSLRTRHLTAPTGADVALTKGEYALLVAFLDAPQRPLSREHLLQATRVHEDVFDRSIDVQILRLRRKLEQDPSAPQMIQTERGVGYIFARPLGWIPTRSATPSTALVPQRKVGFPIPNAGLLLGFQGTKTARRGGISSPFSDAGGCTSP